MAAEHGMLVSPVSNARVGVWAGRFSFTTATTGVQTATITDTGFSTMIIRASNHIVLTSANITAASLYGTAVNRGVYAQMTNNASILVGYYSNGAGGTPSFYFMVFGGGTIT
jgi:hypothetical protein